MATLLDTFFTKLGFEVDEAALESATAKVASLGKSLLGLGVFSGLSVGGILELTTSTAEAMAQVQLLSDRSQVATETIAGMTRAAVDFDVSADEVGESLESVNRALGGIVTGTAPRMTRVFKMLGFSAKDAAGNQKDVITFLGDVAEKIKGLSAGGQQQVLSRLGISPNMVLMLRNGRDAFLQMFEAAKGGIPFKAEDYERAEQFNLAWRKAKLSIGNAGKAIALDLMVPLKKFIDEFNKWWATNGKQMLAQIREGFKAIGDWVLKADAAFTRWTGGINVTTVAMTALAGAMALVVSLGFIKWVQSSYSAVMALVGWVGESAEALGKAAVAAYQYARGLDAVAGAAEVADAATIEFTIWGLAIAAVLLLLIGLMALLVQDFMVWRRGGDSAIGRLQKRFPELFDLIKRGVKFLEAQFLQLWDAIKQLWKVVGPTLLQFMKWLFIIGAVYIGEVIAELLILAYIGVLVFVKLLTWAIKLQTFLATLIPVDKIKAKWKETFDYLKAEWQDWVDGFNSAVQQVEDYWDGLMAAFHAAHDWLKAQWTELCTHFTSLWQKVVDGIKGAWAGLMKWLDPVLKRIEAVMGFIGGKIKGAATGVVDFMSAPMPGGPMAAAAGVGMMAPATSNFYAHNAQRTHSVTHNTDVKATINVQAPDPDKAATLTRDKLQQVTTRNAQGGHF